jgi:hypothetical protein
MEDKLKLTKVEEIIDAVALLSQPPKPNCQQKLLLKVGLVSEEDLWYLTYKQRMAKLEQVLLAEQINMVKQVFIQGAN